MKTSSSMRQVYFIIKKLLNPKSWRAHIGRFVGCSTEKAIIIKHNTTLKRPLKTFHMKSSFTF